MNRVTRIIRTSLKALIFGAFRLVVLARLIPCVVLRTKNHLKVKALRSEIFWLTNICQRQENAEDCILILSRRLTNWWRIFVAKKLVRIIFVTLAVRESNLIASRRLIYASFGVISLARLIPCFAKSHQNPSKINSPWGAKQFWRSRFFREQGSFRWSYINIIKERTAVIGKICPTKPILFDSRTTDTLRCSPHPKSSKN